MKAYIEIHAPGYPAARHPLEVGRLTIGKGIGSSIQLPESAGCVVEQLELAVSEAGVRVQVPSGASGTFIFEGAEQRQLLAPFGSEVFLGNIRLGFRKDSGPRKASPVLLLLAPAVMIFAGLGAYNASEADVSKAEVEAPVLVGSAPQTSCPEQDPVAAERRARDGDRAAAAKQQRSAFELADGIDAITLWQKAGACFTTAGKPEQAARTEQQAADWTARLNTQYATLRMQLRAALDSRRDIEALSTVRNLQSLLARHEPGPYQRWLAQLRESLERKMAKAEAEA